MIGVILWSIVGSIGLFAVGHVLPGTKPYCRRASKKMWRYTGKRAQQAWRANREAKRRRQAARFASDPKARARNRRRTAAKSRPYRLTGGHRPEEGRSVADRLNRARINRNQRTAEPKVEGEPIRRRTARHVPHPNESNRSGGSSKCGAETQDGSPCQRLVNAEGKCGIPKHDRTRQPRQSRPPRQRVN